MLTKTGVDISVLDAKTISITLTQEESLRFVVDKKIDLQLNWTYLDGGITKRAATKIIPINLEKQLLM